MKKTNNSFIGWLIGIVVGSLLLTALILSHSASFKRNVKSLVSNYSGGLDRTVTVYDYSGEPIKSWTGKFDVSESESEVFFDDENGKRVIIHGGIVVTQEN